MKKFFSLSMVLALLLVLVGCATAATQPAAVAATAAPKKLHFGVTVNNATADSNQGAHYQELKKYGESKGIEMTMLDPAGKPETQISQIENLIQMKVDVIIIRATNATAIIPAMKKAKEAGIPVLVTTNIVDKSGFDYMTAFVGPSDLLQAKAAFKVFEEYYTDHPSTKDTLNILEVQHVPGTTVTTLRTQGFAEAIAGTKFKILDAQTAEGKREKGQQITEAWLLKYKPGEIDGIYVEGTGMGFGVTNAILAANRVGEFPVVFIATTKESFALIKNGQLYGSVDQSPLVEADLTIETAIKITKGEKVDQFTYLPIYLTTQKNIATAVEPTW